jgi:hypothetical protein
MGELFAWGDNTHGQLAKDLEATHMTLGFGFPQGVFLTLLVFFRTADRSLLLPDQSLSAPW